jgi:uncharacterized membrane protein YkvA (DUF1232 family)
MSIHPQAGRAGTTSATRQSSTPVPNLRHVTTGELCQSDNSRLTDVIVLKLNTLDRQNFIEQQVLAKVRVLLELLRDTLTGRYTRLSVAAFAEILLAMDYFIEVYDEIPDTWPHGYEDDLRRIDGVWQRYRSEIAAYLEAS